MPDKTIELIEKLREASQYALKPKECTYWKAANLIEQYQKDMGEAVELIVDGGIDERTTDEWDVWEERKAAFLKKMDKSERTHSG